MNTRIFEENAAALPMPVGKPLQSQGTRPWKSGLDFHSAEEVFLFFSQGQASSLNLLWS